MLLAGLQHGVDVLAEQVRPGGGDREDAHAPVVRVAAPGHEARVHRPPGQRRHAAGGQAQPVSSSPGVSAPSASIELLA
jgi:hypothetical protein